MIRSGFPDACPAGRAGPVCGNLCAGCEHRTYTERGTWRCDHPAYQQADGWRCEACGDEISPWGQSRGWRYCGGPEECRKERRG